MLPALIPPCCNRASRTACASPSRSEQLIYTVAAKDPFSPGIKVCSKIKSHSGLNPVKLVLGEGRLRSRKLPLYCELLGWSRSDGRTSGALRRDDDEVVLVLPDSSPFYSDLGICVLVRACFSCSWVSLLAVSPGSAKPNTALCRVWEGSHTLTSTHPNEPVFQTQLVLMLPTYSFLFFTSECYSICISVLCYQMFCLAWK